MKERTIDFMLRTTWQAVARMYNEEASKFDGSMAIGFLLLSIDKEAGTPSTALGPKMGMEPTSLTRTLKSLEEKGLIVKEKNPKDGRGVIIKLTKIGIEKRELSKQTVIKFNAKIKETVCLEKLQAFYDVNDAINELITNKEIFGQN